jgi:hypothetical protein
VAKFEGADNRARAHPVPQAQGVDAKIRSISTLHGVVSRKRKNEREGTVVAARGETL